MIKRAARRLLHGLGAIEMFRYVNRRALRVLFYHHFSEDTETLELHCAHLRRFYHPVTMQNVADHLHEGVPLPSNAVAVTVDDGYRDFLTAGWPVFRAYGIPCTMFLVSDFIDRKTWLWWNVVEYAVAGTRLPSVRFGSRTFQTADPQPICDFLKTLPNDERVLFVAKIGDLLEVDIPADPPAPREPLSWDEIRQLAAEGVEFGGHTRSHPILARVTHGDELDDEIGGCKRRIEAELGRPVSHFCYPNGRYGDFTAAAVQAVRNSGYRTAVTTERGLNTSGVEPLMLRRIGAEPHIAIDAFSELLAGARREIR